MFFHFTDTPIIYWNDDPDKIKIRDENIYDVAYAMANATDILKDSQKDEKKKIKSGLIDSLMLRYIIHIIGDIHQPLHCSSMFSLKKFNGSIIDGD